MKGTTTKINSQEEGLPLITFLAPLTRLALPLIKNVLTPYAKNILVKLGLKSEGLATNAAIQKKVFRSGMTASIISNKEMKDIIKIVKILVEFGLLIKLTKH